ncbi:MAG: hypothetical protein H7145_00880 [Akkermansiaceae bacterium]|nr:hypothetical protein [Armatimonadota bacterium]
MDTLSPSSPQSTDSILTTTPPPLPVLGAAVGQIPLQRQAWVGESNTFQMVMSPGRQTWKDSLSDYRTGQIIIDAAGCTITGKAVLPANIRVPILVVCLVLRVGWLIAYLILEYAIRRDQTDRLTWNEIDCVLVQTPKKRVCVIYHLPEKPKTRYALGLKMKDGGLDDFLGAVRSHASERIVEGKIGGATPLAVWIILGLFVAILGFILWGAVSP